MTQSLRYLSTVEHIMNVHVPVVFAGDPVSKAVAAIEMADEEPVAVVDADYRLAGVLTPQASLAETVVTAGQAATTPKMTVSPQESVFAVISRMLSKRINWVPVLQDGKFVGALSRSSVLTAFGETHGG